MSRIVNPGSIGRYLLRIDHGDRIQRWTGKAESLSIEYDEVTSRGRGYAYTLPRDRKLSLGGIAESSMVTVSADELSIVDLLYIDNGRLADQVNSLTRERDRLRLERDELEGKLQAIRAAVGLSMGGEQA